LEARFLGSTLKRMLSRSFMALSVKRVALSVAVCAKSTGAPIETKPQIATHTKDNPFPVIKPGNLRRP